MLLFPAIMVSFDPAEIWQRVEWADGSPPPTRAEEVVEAQGEHSAVEPTNAKTRNNILPRWSRSLSTKDQNNNGDRIKNSLLCANLRLCGV